MSRTKVSGPSAGTYGCFASDSGIATITPGAVTTTARILIPANFRISQIDLGNVSSAGGASRPTVQITDGTNNLFSGAATLVTAAVVSVTPTSAPSLVAAQRTRAKADILQVQVTTVAVEALAGFSCRIHGFYLDHVVSTGSTPDQND